MSDQYSLRVKIGGAEFEAAGPEETVKDAYQAFLGAIQATHIAQRPEDQLRVGHDDQDGVEHPEFPAPILERAFKVDRDKGVVSLRFHPRSDGDQRLADSVILLVYGMQKLLGTEYARVTKLNDGLKQTGFSTKRMDSYIGLHKGLYRKTGQRSGSRYALTNAGEQWAEETLRGEFISS